MWGSAVVRKTAEEIVSVMNSFALCGAPPGEQRRRTSFYFDVGGG